MFEYRYKPPFYLRRWFQGLVTLFFIGTIAGVIGSYAFLKPYRDKAEEFDFADINKLEHASIMYDRHGAELGRIHVVNRDPVPFDKVPLHMRQALTAIEDARFFEHNGVDYMGILRAMLRNAKAGSANQGASTITQQLARNAYELTARTYERKLVEAFLAIRIEKNFSKTQIMEMYLNRIYFGSSFYGVNAAAKGYFGKEISEISIEEAATLAGLIKSPNRLSPFNNPDQSKAARDYVFERMVEENMLTRGRAEELKEIPVVVVQARGERKRSLDYAYELVRQQVVKQIGFEQASEGGFHIFTTIDQPLQLAAQQSLVKNLDRIEKDHLEKAEAADRKQSLADYEAKLEAWNNLDPVPAAEGQEPDTAAKPPLPEYLQGAVLAIDNKTGAIRALVGGRDFGHSNFDRTRLARRKPGTAFKPLVYAAGFTRGKFFPGSKIDDSPLDNRYVMIGGETGILAEWGVETAENSYESWMPARTALLKGKNAATVRFGLEVGVQNVVQVAQDAGITFEGEIQEYPSTFLGNSEASMEEMALAYTIFPNGGKRPNHVFIIDSIRDGNGTKIFAAGTEPDVEVIDPYSAYQVHGALAEALESGTAAKAREKYGLGKFPAAAKTGTAYDFKDDWVIGYTSELTCAVWSGFDKAATIYNGAFSNETVLPIWTDVVNASAEIFPPQQFDPPSDARRAEICKISGDRATQFCSHKHPAADGTETEVRDTYIEFLDPKYTMRRDCAVHGPGGDINQQLLQPVQEHKQLTYESDRAIRPTDYVLNVQPIFLQAPTVLGEDPYNSVVPTIRPRLIVPPKPREPVEVPDPAETGAPPPDPEAPPAPAPAPVDPDAPAPIFKVPPGPRPADPVPAAPATAQPAPATPPARPPVPVPLRRTEDGLPSVLDERQPESLEVPKPARIQFD